MDTTAPLDKEIMRLRTHPKVLFKPVLLQLLFLVFHYLFTLIPHMGTANQGFDLWLRVVLHGTIVVLEIVYALVPVLRWLTDSFTITEKQVKTDTGIIARKSQEIHVSRISQVEVDRGLLDRIFGSGTIRLYNASNTLGLEFRDVPKVKKVKESIDRQRGL